MPPTRHTNHRRGSSQNIPDLVPRLPPAPQTSCPLFSVFPAEIRNRIYALTLESEDTASESSPDAYYKRNAYYFRPGYKQPKRIQTGLLQTCQQIYAEASLLPPGINEHTFWFYRPPPHVKNASSPLNYFRKMTPRQRGQVNHLHLFTQQFFLEDDRWSDVWDGIQMGNEGRSLRGACRIAPKRLTITLRHTDWWFWENNDHLGIDPFRSGRTTARQMDQPALNQCSHKLPWGAQFSSIPSLEELVIEFETVMRKRHQLDDIIRRALDWKFPMDSEKSLYLVAEPSSRSAYTWTGAKEGDLRRQGPGPGEGSHSHQQHGEAPANPTLKPFEPETYVSATAKTANSEGKLFAPGYEDFYVVFLTWRKQSIVE